jgi:hypothetical protein
MTDKDISHDEMVEVVSQQFKIESEAAEYLNQHPMLYPYIVESIGKIKVIFGKDVDLELLLVKDPEIANLQTLYCYIWVSMTVDEALEKLDKFDSEYYLKLPSQITDFLNYNVRSR